jgi:hypothetical protein
MVSLEKIDSYMSRLRCSEAKPHFREAIISSVDMTALAGADTETKLLTAGAFFSAGKFAELAELLLLLDFNEMASDDRFFLPLCIFKEYYESYLEAPSGTRREVAGAVENLLVAICPEIMSAHTLLPGDGAGQRQPLDFAYATTVSPSVRGVVFFREFMFSQGSRKHEFGHRIQTALASQGWDVALLANPELLHYTTSSPLDFALVDTALFDLLPDPESRFNCFKRLRQYVKKIIVIEPDPWASPYDVLVREISSQVDYVWGFTSEWDILADPCCIDKGIFFPNVGGFDHLRQLKLAVCNWETCTFNFTGSVLSYNLNRAYWVLELLRRGMPVSTTITCPSVDDGLDRESSLQLYAHSLASTHAALNFTTRRDGSRIITGRSAEIISLNRLLIQESCPVFHDYYQNGEHFLEFGDIDGLCTVIDFLSTHPTVAQRICSQGYQFYQERYSSRKMVEHIQTLL